MNSPPPARVLALAELRKADTALVDFVITRDEMTRFAELSGDFNPLHTDEAFARTKGFDGVVVYGALLCAKVSQLIGMKLPGRDSVWVGLSLEFRKPLYVGQAAQVEGTVSDVSESTGLVTLKITVRALGKVLAKGSADVLLGR